MRLTRHLTGAILTLGLALVAAPPAASSAGLSDPGLTDAGFAAMRYADAVSGDTLDYCVFVPREAAAGSPYPMVTLLPGPSSRSALILASDAVQARTPCFVLVPQVPADYNMMGRLVSALAASERVDDTRLYLAGEAGGADAAMAFDAAVPGLFAASMIVDGHAGASTIAEIARQPMIYFATEADDGAASDVMLLETAARRDGVSCTFAQWSAALPETRQCALAEVMLDKGATMNLFVLEPDGVDVGESAWHNTAALEWLMSRRRP